MQRDDVVVTAGCSFGPLPSLYPRGIPIGIVTASTRRDIDLY